LREQGFEEGQNITVDYKRNDDPCGPFSSAAELMRSAVDLVVATGPEVTLQAVIGASRSIPIVFLAVQYDPIARGYVNSLAYPGATLREYSIDTRISGQADWKSWFKPFRKGRD
jgi:putative ABC transport system substrate-binding protein